MKWLRRRRRAKDVAIRRETSDRTQVVDVRGVRAKRDLNIDVRQRR